MCNEVRYSYSHSGNKADHVNRKEIIAVVVQLTKLSHGDVMVVFGKVFISLI